MGESVRKIENGKCEMTRQQKMIREFYSKLQSCTSKGMEPVTKFVIILFEVLITHVMLIPYEKNGIKIYAICVLGMTPWPVQMSLSPYLYVTEHGKNYSVYEKLRYLPVERKEIRRVCVEYLLRFLRIPFLCGMLAQLSGCLLAGQGIGLGNILCPLLVTGVFPFLLGLALIGKK